MKFDTIISHASEDKNSFVRELAKRLEEQRILVWYDEFTLKPGSSLMRSIDIGLSKCRFGIVVLSENFFKKKWTNWELDGLVARQNALENEMIIPIWLGITKDKLLEYSPSLADKVAINANIGIEKVVTQLIKVIKPKGSTLVIARELVFNEGLTPPLVTDDWWLDVIEYCGKEFQDEYLSFSIPWKGWDPKERGEYIGLNALQMLWQDEADRKGISQLSHPEEVLEFIESQPGLKKTCLKNPKRVALYFPQLTIKNFGGFLEQEFEKLLNVGSRYHSQYECEEEVALRYPNFGNYDFTALADFYFTGAGGGIAPPTSRYDQIEFVVWLLSAKSEWLPTKIRRALLEGLKEWAVWDWQDRSNSISDFKSNSLTGSLFEALCKAQNFQNFKLTKDVESDIKTRILHSKKILKLPEKVDDLFSKFLDEELIQNWFKRRYVRHRRRKKASG